MARTAIKADTDQRQIEEVEKAYWESVQAELEVDYEELVRNMIPIAYPVASPKLTKKICRVLRKSADEKMACYRGVKMVNKALRKKMSGIVIIGGDVTPIDRISHLPIICEENNVPYCYLPSSILISNAAKINKPVECVMVFEKEKYASSYKKLHSKVLALPKMIN